MVRRFGPPEVAVTATFYEMVDMFFDCLNVRGTTEYNRKNRLFLAPFRSVDDDRFGWLEKTFLGYLHSWEARIDSRPGNYSQDAKSRMFISLQTYQGFQITIYSVIEATKFILNHSVEFVQTEKCQKHTTPLWKISSFVFLLTPFRLD